MAVIPLVGQPNVDQDYILALAEKHFAAKNYHKSAELYKKILKIDPENSKISYKLAESYRNNFQYDKAEIFYRKVLGLSFQDHLSALFHLASIKKITGNYKESNALFQAFLDSANTAETRADNQEIIGKAIIEQKGNEIAIMESEEEGIVSINLLREPVNSSFNDYAPSLSGKGLLAFSSGRGGSGFIQKKDLRTGEIFTDLFFYDLANQQLHTFNKLNHKYHEGAGAFFPADNYFIYTSCGKKEKGCKLILAEKEKGLWVSKVYLFEDDLYNYKHPALSFTGDTLYFSSDRPGGFGGFDLWMSIRKNNSEWTVPINLGERINSAGDEISPFFAGKYNLFFASNSYPGYGGYDLFLGKTFSSGEVEVINLGEPVNSSYDEAFLLFNDTTGYFSSNRPEGIGGFDIYSFPAGSREELISRILQRNKKNKDSEPLIKSRLNTYSNIDLYASRSEDKLAYEDLPDAEKAVIDELMKAKDEDQLVVTEDHGFSEKKRLILTEIARKRYFMLNYGITENNPVAFHTFNIHNNNYVTVKGVTYSEGKIIDNKVVHLKDSVEDIIMTTASDAEGKFLFTNVLTGHKYEVEVAEELGEEIEISALEVIKYGDRGRQVKVDNIFFDFDNYIIRPEAKEAIKELVALISDQSHVKVEIHAFADGIGGVDYNFWLSHKRGENVALEMEKLGITHNRLTVKARGKEAPLATNKSQLGRQLNRRVELYITGFEEPLKNKIYILRKGLSLKELARNLNIQEDEIIRWNNQNSRYLEQYQPIRLERIKEDFPDNLLIDPDIHSPTM